MFRFFHAFSDNNLLVNNKKKYDIPIFGSLFKEIELRSLEDPEASVDSIDTIRNSVVIRKIKVIRTNYFRLVYVFSATSSVTIIILYIVYTSENTGLEISLLFSYCILMLVNIYRVFIGNMSNVFSKLKDVSCLSYSERLTIFLSYDFGILILFLIGAIESLQTIDKTLKNSMEFILVMLIAVDRIICDNKYTLHSIDYLIYKANLIKRTNGSLIVDSVDGPKQMRVNPENVREFIFEAVINDERYMKQIQSVLVIEGIGFMAILINCIITYKAAKSIGEFHLSIFLSLTLAFLYDLWFIQQMNDTRQQMLLFLNCEFSKSSMLSKFTSAEAKFLASIAVTIVLKIIFS
jgi:hypothetical protein